MPGPNSEVLEVGDGRAAIRVDDVYATDADDLWQAVTDPERLARWLVEVTGELKVGGEIFTRFTSTAEGPGRIEVCDPPRRLLVAMHGDEGDDPTTIEATLTSVDDGTRLMVLESGFTPKQAPFHASGWTVHLEDLRSHLEGRPREPWSLRWRADMIRMGRTLPQ